MQNFLFHNYYTGEGAVGVVAGDTFETTRSFGPNSFAINWSSIEPTPRGLFFYNSLNGAAAIGSLSEGDFATTTTFPAGSFARQWTHVCDTLECALFYNGSTGEAAIVTGFLTPAMSIQTVKSYPEHSFPIASHVVRSSSDPSVILIYDVEKGSGVIGQRFSNQVPTSQPEFPFCNDFRILHILAPGYFSPGWSHIVSLDKGELLFYNRLSGAGAVGSLTAAGFTTTRVYPAGAFSIGWDNIARAGDAVLFYNGIVGSAAIGFDPTLRTFPAGSFSTGWTRVVGQVDPTTPS